MTAESPGSPTSSTDLPTIGQCLREAANLPTATWMAIGELAEQIRDVALLPVIGSGASIECKAPSVGKLAKQLAAVYKEKVPASERPSDFEYRLELGDLGALADAIHLIDGDQKAVVEALEFDNNSLWPSVGDIPKHFCSYRVLARFAREGFLSEAMTLNYDCHFERGLREEGFVLSDYAPVGRAWLDHATVIADSRQNASFRRRGAFVLTKAHGCVERYRALSGSPAKPPGSDPADSIIIRKGQLLDWRTDLWARDIVTERSRRHVLLLMGFSGTDPVINVTLNRILEEVRKESHEPDPRVIVIDKDPETIALRGLTEAGCPPGKAPVNGVTSLSTAGASMAATTLALLAESLRLRLEPVAREAGLSLPADPAGLLGALVLNIPQALRWSYLLAPPDPAEQYAQWLNLEQAAEKGYVPLASSPPLAVRALRLRQLLRARLGLRGPESIAQVIADQSTVASGGIAYVPTCLTPAQLEKVSRANKRRAREALLPPTGLSPVLVGLEGEELICYTLDSGKRVEIP